MCACVAVVKDLFIGIQTSSLVYFVTKLTHTISAPFYAPSGKEGFEDTETMLMAWQINKLPLQECSSGLLQIRDMRHGSMCFLDFGYVAASVGSMLT